MTFFVAAGGDGSDVCVFWLERLRELLKNEVN